MFNFIREHLEHNDMKENMVVAVFAFAFLAVAFGFVMGGIVTKLDAMTVVELPKG